MCFLSILDNMSIQKNLVKMVTVNKVFLSAISIKRIEKFFADNEKDICCIEEIKQKEYGESELEEFKTFLQKKRKQREKGSKTWISENFNPTRLLEDC